jgi:hypothetical protein
MSLVQKLKTIECQDSGLSGAQTIIPELPDLNMDVFETRREYVAAIASLKRKHKAKILRSSRNPLIRKAIQTPTDSVIENEAKEVSDQLTEFLGEQYDQGFFKKQFTPQINIPVQLVSSIADIVDPRDYMHEGKIMPRKQYALWTRNGFFATKEGTLLDRVPILGTVVGVIGGGSYAILTTPPGSEIELVSKYVGVTIVGVGTFTVYGLLVARSNTVYRAITQPLESFVEDAKYVDETIKKLVEQGDLKSKTVVAVK